MIDYQSMKKSLDEACTAMARHSRDESVQEQLEQQCVSDDVLAAWATAEAKALHPSDAASTFQSHEQETVFRRRQK